MDRDPTKKPGEFEDVSSVKKYEMSSEEYAKRGGKITGLCGLLYYAKAAFVWTATVMAFKKQYKLGRFSEKDATAKEEEEERERHEKDEAEAIAVGSRCEVTLPHDGPKRGTVMFVGKVEFKPGYWIGVKYDEPLGRNDGR